MDETKQDESKKKLVKNDANNITEKRVNKRRFVDTIVYRFCGGEKMNFFLSAVSLIIIFLGKQNR